MWPRVEQWAHTPRSVMRLGLPCTLPLQSVWHAHPLPTHLHEAAAVACVHTCTLPPPSLRYKQRHRGEAAGAPGHTATSICTPLTTRTASHCPHSRIAHAAHAHEHRRSTHAAELPSARPASEDRPQARGCRHRLTQGSGAKEGGLEVTWFRLSPPGGVCWSLRSLTCAW